MNWYNKIVLSGSIEEYLKSLGASPDIIQFIVSQGSNSQLLVNEFRKNPSLTIEQLKSYKFPQKQEIDPYLSHEKSAANFYSDGDNNFYIWILVNFRKLRKGKIPYNNDINQLGKTLTSEELDIYWFFNNKLEEIRDWVNHSIPIPNISSFSAGQAINASEEWHRMMASKGEGVEYDPIRKDLIIYGPKWKNKEWYGWTIQKVISANDLEVEGNKMDHCVGSFCEDVERGTSNIYSLRDPQNNPHVTMEVGGEKDYHPGAIKQIQGKSNSDPKQTYKEMIKEWMSFGKDKEGINREINSFENLEELHPYNGPSVSNIINTIDQIIQDDENEYGLKYIFDSDIETIIDKVYSTAKEENKNYRTRDGKYIGDITEASSSIINLALKEDLGLKKFPKNSKEWAFIKSLPKKTDWKNIDIAEQWAFKVIDDLQEDFYSQETGLDHPQEEDFEEPEEFQKAEERFYEEEAEIYDEWTRNSLEGGFAKDLLDNIESFRKMKIIPSAQDLYEIKKNKNEKLLIDNPAFQKAYNKGQQKVENAIESRASCKDIKISYNLFKQSQSLTKSSIKLTPKEESIFNFLKKVKKDLNLDIQMRVAGGWVRDKLLGKNSDDIDIAINMPGYDFAKLVVEEAIRHNITKDSKAYKVSLEKSADPEAKVPSDNLMVGAVYLFGQKIEFVPMRTEYYPDPNSRQPQITTTNDPREDVKRRDLTINALYYNIDTGKIDDFVGGIKDLGLDGSSGIILRTPDDSFKTFHEDPLRLLRVLRFHSRYSNSKIDRSIIEAMSNKDIQESYRKKVATERAGPELMKMLSGDDPVNSLRLLFESGLYKTVFNVPSMEDINADGIYMDQQTPHHKFNLLDHTLQVVGNLNKIMKDNGESDYMRGLMNVSSLFHDFGKMKNGIQRPHPKNKDQMQYLGHEDMSKTMADDILKSIGVGKDERDIVNQVIGLHMRPLDADKWSNKGRGSFLRDTRMHGKENDHKDLWKYIFYHAQADSMASQPENFNHEKNRETFNNFKNFVESPSGSFSGTVINGNDVMKIFPDLKPDTGYIKEVLDYVKEMQDTNKIDMSGDINDAKQKAIDEIKQIAPQIINKYKKSSIIGNWYKKAQKNYGDIGHSGVGSGNENILWICNPDGSNFKTEEGWYIDGHGNMIDGGLEEANEKKMRGRYNPNNKEVSILLPYGWYWDVPNIIINKLIKEFGKNIKISIFSAESGYIGERTI